MDAAERRLPLKKLHELLDEHLGNRPLVVSIKQSRLTDADGYVNSAKLNLMRSLLSHERDKISDNQSKEHFNTVLKALASFI
ncbi:MAG TPA: hypothetical protein VJH55_04105 [Candidatus Paceibacterota bacterium]